MNLSNLNTLNTNMQGALNHYLNIKNKVNDVAEVKTQFIKFLEDNKFTIEKKEKDIWNYTSPLYKRDRIVVSILTSLTSFMDSSYDIEVNLFKEPFGVCYYSFKVTLDEIENLKELLNIIQNDISK